MSFFILLIFARDISEIAYSRSSPNPAGRWQMAACKVYEQKAQLSQRPRDASCLSVVSFNIPTARFFYYQLLRLQIY